MANRSILLYRDNGSTEPYELKTATFDVQPNGVAIVTWVMEKNLNAFTVLFRTEMFLMLEHINRCPDVKVVLWTGKGRAFSAGAALGNQTGHDLSDEVFGEYARRGQAPNLKTDTAFVNETRAFWDCTKPLIAAVNGMAIGGAANMVLGGYFDMVYISPQAKLRYPFVEIGLSPELGSSLTLPLQLGLFRAKEAILSAQWITAQQAYEWGRLNYLGDDYYEKALEKANEIASKPLGQLVVSKKVLNHFLRSNLDNALRFENEQIHESMYTFDGIEGFKRRMMEQMAKKQEAKAASKKAKL